MPTCCTLTSTSTDLWTIFERNGLFMYVQKVFAFEFSIMKKLDLKRKCHSHLHFSSVHILWSVFRISFAQILLGLYKTLTVICEDVPTYSLIDHMTFRQGVVPLPVSTASTVLCDQTGYSSLIQHVSRCPLWTQWEDPYSLFYHEADGSTDEMKFKCVIIIWFSRLNLILIFILGWTI